MNPNEPFGQPNVNRMEWKSTRNTVRRISYWIRWIKFRIRGIKLFRSHSLGAVEGGPWASLLQAEAHCLGRWHSCTTSPSSPSYSVIYQHLLGPRDRKIILFKFKGTPLPNLWTSFTHILLYGLVILKNGPDFPQPADLHLF